MAQMVRAMRAIMSMESLGAAKGDLDSQKPELDFRRSTSEDDIDALEVPTLSTPIEPKY